MVLGFNAFASAVSNYSCRQDRPHGRPFGGKFFIS